MNAKDKPDFTLAITALCETLGREASDAMLYGYWVALVDLPIEAVQRSVAKALRICKFMPSPAELRELSGESREEAAAILAWATVDKASAVGSYRSVDFDDPIINAAIRTMGGWPALLEKTPQEFDTWARKEFIRVYVSLARSGVTGDICRPLPGLGDSGVKQVQRLDGSVGEITMQPLRIRCGTQRHREPERIAARTGRVHCPASTSPP